MGQEGQGLRNRSIAAKVLREVHSFRPNLRKKDQIHAGFKYYTLSYAPSNAKFDGRLRKIRVQLPRRGAHLAYRHSYLADDSMLDQGADPETMRLQVALRRGAPLAQELFLQARLAPQGRARQVTKEEIAQLAGFPDDVRVPLAAGKNVRREERGRREEKSDSAAARSGNSGGGCLAADGSARRHRRPPGLG